MKDLKQRLLDGMKVDESTGCWEWQHSLRLGYGAIKVQGKLLGTHRLAFVVFTNQQIPVDKEICHSCDNRKCINPHHLILGTQSENMNDKKERRRCVVGNSSSLSYEKAIEIKNSKRTNKELASLYKVTTRTIQRIRNGHTRTNA